MFSLLFYSMSFLFYRSSEGKKRYRDSLTTNMIRYSFVLRVRHGMCMFVALEEIDLVLASSFRYSSNEYFFIPRDFPSVPSLVHTHESFFAIVILGQVFNSIFLVLSLLPSLAMVSCLRLCYPHPLLFPLHGNSEGHRQYSHVETIFQKNMLIPNSFLFSSSLLCSLVFRAGRHGVPRRAP